MYLPGICEGGLAWSALAAAHRSNSEAAAGAAERAWQVHLLISF